MNVKSTDIDSETVSSTPTIHERDLNETTERVSQKDMENHDERALNDKVTRANMESLCLMSTR